MTQWTAERWCNEGASLLRDDLPLARRMINQSIQKGPENSITWYNLGISLHQQRRIPAAIRAYRHALGLRDAPVSNILSNLSQDLLLNGSFEEGWHAYEHRLTDKIRSGNKYDLFFLPFINKLFEYSIIVEVSISSICRID